MFRAYYADFGAVHAAFLLGRLLEREVALKHLSSLGWEDIWNSNTIFVGKADLRPAVLRALKDMDFVATEFGDLRNLRPRSGEREMYVNAATHGEGEEYALVTVVPGPVGRQVRIRGAGSQARYRRPPTVISVIAGRPLAARISKRT